MGILDVFMLRPPGKIYLGFVGIVMKSIVVFTHWCQSRFAAFDWMAEFGPVTPVANLPQCKMRQ